MAHPRIHLEIGTFNPELRVLEREAGAVRLSPTEARLLAHLAAHPGVPLSPDDLLREVWGYAPGVRSRTVYSTVERLRAKIERDPANPRHVLSLPGAGYRFEPLDTARPRSPDLVGRDADLAVLAERVAPGQVVSVVGLGGVGKTALVLGFLRDRPEGLLCDLAAARGALDVVSAVAGALGVPLLEADPAEQVGRVLAGRGGIVALDNLEQVVEHAPATIGRWREMAPKTAFVVTSRVPLGLEGERVLALEPLPAKGEDSPAVELLCRRGRAASPGFARTAENGADLAALAAGLDGLPLAIELAAARLRIIAPAQMLARLNERFRLLGRDERRGERHSTLQACIAWSWDLLDPWEQAALAQLSVFEGGFSREAAQAVLDLSPWPAAPAASEVLRALADKSLARPAGDRFEILLSIRDFAASMLRDGGAEARHGARFARWGERDEIEALRAAGGVALRAARRQDLPNLIAASRRALARGDLGVAAGAGLAASALMLQEAPQGAIDLLDTLLREPGLRRRAEALLMRGQATLLAGRPEGGEAALREACALAAAAGDARVEARAMVYLAEALRERGQIAESNALLAAAIPLSRAAGDEWGEALGQQKIGINLNILGEGAESLARYEAALAGYRRAGDAWGEGVALGSLGYLLWIMGRIREGRELLQQAIAIHRAVHNRRAEGIDRTNLAALASALGENEEAQREYEAALALHRAVGNRRSEGLVLGNLAMLEVSLGRMKEAEARFLAALALNRAVANSRSEAIALQNLGKLYRLQGRLKEAEEALDAGISLLRVRSFRRFLYFALWVYAELRLDQGRPAEAADLLREALDLVQVEDHRAHVGYGLGLLGAAALASGDEGGADALLAEGFASLSGEDLPSLRAQLLIVLGELRLRQGRLSEAREAAAEAESLVPRGVERYHVPPLLCLRARVALAEGDRAEAAEHLAKAEAMAAEMGLAWPRLRAEIAGLRRALAGRL